MKETMMYEESIKNKKLHKSESEAAIKKLSLVSVLCITFMMIEFFGGYISGSMAIMTDAAHLLSDFSGFVISMASVWIGTKEANRRLSFGYHRAEVIGALASVILIWGLTLVLILEAIDRIINPVEVDGKIMLITASLGLLFNLIMVKILHSSGDHSHHNCSHKYPSEEEQITYEMEELGIDQIDIGGNIKDDESLHLKHNDSLAHSEVLDDAPSKSFDFGTFKLEGDFKQNSLNRSNIYDFKPKTQEQNSREGSCQNGDRRTEDRSRHQHDHHDQHDHYHAHHHHDHDHHAHHQESKNLNVRAAVIHIIGDIIQAIGVLIAALLIYIMPSWQLIDPI